MSDIQLRIPEEYWDKLNGRWNSHKFFNTINHWHISDYESDTTCDLMLVECMDGRFYIVDNWGGDADGHHEVFNPYDKNSYPTFFESFEQGNRTAAAVVASITGAKAEEIMIKSEE